VTPPAQASPAPPGRDLSSWITASRPPRAAVDPALPHGFFLEQERSHDGPIVISGVILLTNKECPWRCLMCDLWKHTTTESVPSGAIARQIEFALGQFEARPEQLKLYNSGSFFDPAAIPVSDYADITRTISFAAHVIVESHPRLVGEKAVRLRDLLSGSLEVAMGLETIHPQVLPRLNKKFDLGHFARAAEFLRNHKILVRAFVLVKPPFMDEAEGLEWAVKSAEFAFACGATAVSLIPTRGGNGAMERLAEAGGFAPPRLANLERALEQALELRAGRVFADLWNLEQFSRCADCLAARRERLRVINLSQSALPAIECSACSGL
jgi:radical SAM enzyme (TIGR01210 family)